MRENSRPVEASAIFDPPFAQWVCSGVTLFPGGNQAI